MCSGWSLVRAASENIQLFLGEAMQSLMNMHIADHDRVMSALHKLEVEIGLLKVSHNSCIAPTAAQSKVCST